MKINRFLIAGLATASLLAASSAAAQTAPTLGVSMAVAPSLPAGTINATVAHITLSAPGGAVTVASVPFTASGNVSALTTCQLRNVNDFSAPLTNNNNIVTTVGANNTLTFDSPITIAAGTADTFFLTCNVASAADGSSVTLGITPGSVSGNAGGTTLTGLNGTDSTGALLATSGTLVFAPVSANTGTVTGTVPAAPNTGAGGALGMNLVILALSGLVALAGALALRRMSTR